MAAGILILAAATATAGGTAAQVRAVTFAEQGDRTVVTIAMSARPTFTAWKLEDPARVVVDVSGASAADAERVVDAGTFAVGAITLLRAHDENGARARIVVTLRRAADYRVEAAGTSILVHIVPRERATERADRRQIEAGERAAGTGALAGEARALVEERARVEAARRAVEAEGRRLVTERERAAAAEAAAVARQQRADEALRGAEAAQARLEQAARSSSREQADKVAQALAQARRETEAAQALARAAATEVERLAAEGRALAGARAEIERQKESLARLADEARRAQAEAEALKKRSEAALAQADGSRRSETERRRALEEKVSEVEARRRALEDQAAAQAAQQAKLAEAARVVAARERELQVAAERLAERERQVARAAAQAAALERAGASRREKAEAAEAVRRAERERKEATEAANASRRELAVAEAARRAEEARRTAIETDRRREEARLEQAMAARAAEEARRGAAALAREQEEARLAAAQADLDSATRAGQRLAAERLALLAELEKLRAVVRAEAARAEKDPVSAIAAPVPVPARTPVAAVPAAERPRSVTLRVPSQIQRIDFVDEPKRSSIIIELDEPSAFVVERVEPGRLSLRFSNAELPRGLERSLDATEYLGPVRVISSYRDRHDRGAVRVDVELAEDVPHRVRQDGGRLYWDFQKGPQSAFGRAIAPRRRHVAAGALAPRPGGGPRLAALQLLAAGWAQTIGSSPANAGLPKRRYTGRRIDLDFKGADIHNILRLLSDVGQVNIVTSDDVKGEVTIKMRDVPWDHALDIVLRQKQLGMVREGNLIRVAPLAVLEKELEQEIARQKQLTDVLPTETRLIGVSYAEASVLQTRARDLLSNRGKISVDERTNQLIVSDVARNLALVEQLVRNLDTQTSQVIIESRIVEARSTFLRSMGIQLGGTTFMDAAHGNPTGLAFPYNIGIAGAADDSDTQTAGLVPSPVSGLGSANPNFAVNLPAPIGTGSGGGLGFTFGSVAGAFNINLRLSALETSGQIRILSSPRISTMDNVEASIEQGVSIPISIISAQGVQTVFVDAKLNLTVTPHVTNEGTIVLKLAVTRNEPDFANTGARGDPTILKKEAKTVMLVRDGDTAVIGGIYTRNSGISHSKVPFFADLPVLGVLFRSKRENDDRTEFLVFITPRVANRARALGQ